jgi:hypothetical protein
MSQTLNQDPIILDNDDAITFWMSENTTEPTLLSNGPLNGVELNQSRDRAQSLVPSLPTMSSRKSNTFYAIHSRPNEPYYEPGESLSPLKNFTSLSDLEMDPRNSYIADYFKSQFDGLKKSPTYNSNSTSTDTMSAKQKKRATSNIPSTSFIMTAREKYNSQQNSPSEEDSIDNTKYPYSTNKYRKPSYKSQWKSKAKYPKKWGKKSKNRDMGDEDE